jgi:hypothetical protein
MKNLKFKREVVVVVIGLLINSLVFAQKAKIIRPKTQNEKIIITGNRAYDYYALNEEKEIKVNVEGPGELIMYTRVLLTKDQKKSSDFIIKYAKDKQKPHVGNISPLTNDPNAKVPGKIITIENKTIISVPPGKHRYLFFKTGSIQAIYSHYAFRKGKKMDWKEANSKPNLEKVVLTSYDKKKTKEYFRINAKQTFTGQAKPGDYLRIMLRSESNTISDKDKKVKIAMLVDGKTVQKYTLFSTKAKKVLYKDEKDKIAGKLKEVVFLIPKKINKELVNYEFVVLENNKNVLIRLNTCSDYQFIAKKDHKSPTFPVKKT